MRYAFLDEAGIANPAQEPFVVVGGALVHADKQYKMLERYLHDMVEDFVPPERRRGFAFHATELFSGGANFERNVWPKEERWKILDELVAIVQKFDLPLVFGRVERSHYATRNPQVKPRQATINAQVISFLMCLNSIETYMKIKAPDEVATIVMENNNEARQLIKAVYQTVRDPANREAIEAANCSQLIPEHVVDDVHFTEKGRSSPSQIADVVAFAVKRHLQKSPESDRFYLPLQRNFVRLPKEEANIINAAFAG
jgi:hypothetical protein